MLNYLKRNSVGLRVLYNWDKSEGVIVEADVSRDGYLILFDDGVESEQPWSAFKVINEKDILLGISEKRAQEEAVKSIEAALREEQEAAAKLIRSQDTKELVLRKIVPEIATEKFEGTLPSDSGSQFDLILFDLDETLLKSAGLDRYRGASNVNNNSYIYLNDLAKASSQLCYVIPEHYLIKVRSEFPELKIGVFTRSPKIYAKTVLGCCYPNIVWDCVVAYEDVAKTKPDPEGIYLAAKLTGVKDLSRIAMIGDEPSDIIAAYQAGVFSILLTTSWGNWNYKDNPIRNSCYEAMNLHPDAKIRKLSELRLLITNPNSFLLSLERTGSDVGISKPRLDLHNHFDNLAEKDGSKNWVAVVVFGRYFSKNNNSRFDFHRKSDSHQVTRDILSAKDGADYPEAWVTCCSNYISWYANHHKNSLIVCPIPARGGRLLRLERLMNRVAERMANQKGVIFDNGLLRFKEGVQSNKELNDKNQRFKNIRNHLEVAKPFDVIEKNIIVIDDVTTTGATLYYADHYLMAAGAKQVQCIALTQSIS